MLQQHSSLKTIKKKLIRKALDMIRKIADEDPDESNDKDKKGSLYLWTIHCLRDWISHFLFSEFLMTLQMLKNPVQTTRRKVNTQSFGMNLESQ